jgi:hypothetical protein
MNVLFLSKLILTCLARAGASSNLLAWLVWRRQTGHNFGLWTVAHRLGPSTESLGQILMTDQQAAGERRMFKTCI